MTCFFRDSDAVHYWAYVETSVFVCGGPLWSPLGGKGLSVTSEPDSLITNAAKDLLVYQSEPRALPFPQETGAITMNPLAHVTQTLLAPARSHWGNSKPPAPVNTRITTRLVHTHKQTEIFQDSWDLHICPCAPKQDTNTSRGIHANIYIHTRTYVLCTQKQKHTKTHTKRGPQRPACGRWTFYVLRQKPSWSKDKTRETEQSCGLNTVCLTKPKGIFRTSCRNSNHLDTITLFLN